MHTFSDIYFFVSSKMNVQEIMQLILQFCAAKNAFWEVYEGNPRCGFWCNGTAEKEERMGYALRSACQKSSGIVKGRNP